MPVSDAVHAALRGVIDPELGDNVVDLGMVQRVDVSDSGLADVTIALTTAGCPLRAQLQNDVRDQVGAVPGVSAVKVHFGEMTAEAKRSLMERARWKARDEVHTDIPLTARIAAVASGKGGVGKSSVTANLAVALARRGLVVGVLDADIGGFSIPRMLGLDEQRVSAEGRKIVPLTLPVEGGSGSGLLKVVSMGSIEGTGEDEAVMLRGLMLNRAVQHFLEDVRWGALDYLLIDMPPGTSDIQMGLARMLPRTEMLIVTTPALAAQKVAARAADMARKGYLRVAGVIENMSAFSCAHGESYALFGTGGGERLAAQVGAPLLGSIPLDPAMAAGGDTGRPVALHGAFDALAARVVEVLPAVEMASCTARLFDQVEAALGPASTEPD
ncbi:MAG TPA: Mrp/NBP35 family ATP-binding protein [Acidimicrobiales bacterium]|jgi:ATP-binding protein involved in chromosome partitioning|nr:Mrp/NBP35 family ATP-binding protein [Acidimicrobiales bacterium]